MRQMRLFIAVNFPDDIKRILGGFIRNLSKVPSDLKWVGQENLHLTVQFLGNVPEERVSAVRAALQKAAAGIAPFELTLERAGAFPSVERPRVLWVGIGGETAPFITLHGRVQREMELLGFEPEKRKFSPHLTLARARSPYGFSDVMKKAQEVASAANVFGTARVESIELMLSELQPKGPRYSILYKALLV